MEVASKAFQNADFYDNARKGYSLESAELLLSKLKDLNKPKQINTNNNKIQTRTILELGAGTGQFTKVLQDVIKGKDFKLIASEPLDSMGNVFRKNFPDLELISCTGEKIRKCCFYSISHLYLPISGVSSIQGFLFMDSLACWLTHSLALSLTNLLTNSLTQSLTTLTH